MTIQAKVKTNAPKNSIEKIDNYNFVIHTTAKPHQDKANDSVIKMISDYFDIPGSLISIEKGQKNKEKTIKIED